MREFSGRSPDSPRKSSFLDLLRIVEMLHKNAGGKCRTEIVEGSLQDSVSHRKCETPSILSSRLLGDLFDFTRDTVATQLAEELVNWVNLNLDY
jgi:hypothetical protein